MTYGEASTSRTAVESGLIYHGVLKVSHHKSEQAPVLFFFDQTDMLWLYLTLPQISFHLKSGCVHWSVFYKQTWVDHSWPCLCWENSLFQSVSVFFSSAAATASIKRGSRADWSRWTASDQGSQYRSKFCGIPDISVLSVGSDIFFTGRNWFFEYLFH